MYGKSEDVPFREDADLVLGPTKKHRWAYACSKAIDEFLALAYWKERKLPVIIVRFFNTVGPRQTGQYGMVIPNFVRQALAGEPITVFGDGQQSRSFTHVADVVWALLKLVNEPKAIGEVINIGNMQEVSILKLAERVRELSGSKSPIKLVPYDRSVRVRVRRHAAQGPRPHEGDCHDWIQDTEHPRRHPRAGDRPFPEKIGPNGTGPYGSVSWPGQVARYTGGSLA